MPALVPMRQQFRRLLNVVLAAKQDMYPLSDFLSYAPSLDSLADIPAGTRVVVRLDLDVPVEDGEVRDQTRLNAAVDTLSFCHARGWTQVLLGHIGRKGASLSPVCDALSSLLGKEVRFIDDWFDEEQHAVTGHCARTVSNAAPGSIMMLENVRRYPLEQALWTSSPDIELATMMYDAAVNLVASLGDIYINDAIAASNRDFSTAVLPLVMSRTALGSTIRSELTALARAQRASMVVMGGVKPDKLDDLEGIVERGFVKFVIVSGALALPLAKAQAEARGAETFSVGAAQSESAGSIRITSDRLDQAARIVSACSERGVRLLLPVDFVLASGESVTAIPADQLQFDIGPASRRLFAEALKDFVADQSASADTITLFYNGVPGKFEEPPFDQGTIELVHAIEGMARSGVEIYTGGGDGGRAFAMYGDIDLAAHAFAAGGTVLKGLSGRPLPMLNSVCVQRSARTWLGPNETASEIRAATSSSVLETVADGVTPSDRWAISPLVERLSGSLAQDDADAESAVCDALCRLGVLNKLGNLNYEAVSADRLAIDARLILQIANANLPSKYSAKSRASAC
jgi:phosphoglycerate kinase